MKKVKTIILDHMQAYIKNGLQKLVNVVQIKAPGFDLVAKNIIIKNCTLFFGTYP